MFYDIFNDLCIKKGIKPSRAAEEIGISRATVTNWKKNGYRPRQDILLRIADYFDVPVSVLVGDEQQKTPVPETGDERDIEKILAETRRKLENQEGLMFDGGIASPEAIDSIIAAMEIGLNIAKKRTAEEKERARRLKEEIIQEAERLEEEDRKHGK